MSIIEILILSLALAADAFTVGATVGLGHRKARQVFRLSFHFGLFQSLLSYLGTIGGSILLDYLQAWDHWVVFIILVLIGLRMITASISKGDKVIQKNRDLTKGFTLIMFSLAVSIDAFAAGVGLEVSNTNILLAIILIGITASSATLLAMVLARGIKSVLAHRSELIGGLILIGLGFKILLEHLLK